MVHVVKLMRPHLRDSTSPHFHRLMRTLCRTPLRASCSTFIKPITQKNDEAFKDVLNIQGPSQSNILVGSGLDPLTSSPAMMTTPQNTSALVNAWVDNLHLNSMEKTDDEIKVFLSSQHYTSRKSLKFGIHHQPLCSCRKMGHFRHISCTTVLRGRRHHQPTNSRHQRPRSRSPLVRIDSILCLFEESCSSPLAMCCTSMLLAICCTADVLYQPILDLCVVQRMLNLMCSPRASPCVRSISCSHSPATLFPCSN